jgi:thymidine kinase
MTIVKQGPKHVRIYMEYFDYATPEEVICEACGSPANDVHHIRGRGVGMDVIGNLMALCRRHHDWATQSKISKDEFQLIHNYFLQGARKIFLT